MASDMARADSIEGSGFPLGFKLAQGRARSPLACGAAGRDVFKVEARQLAGHQKEAVVTEGVSGSSWRLTSDEGKHLKGTDLAPFPLGYFNAGLQADLVNRILWLAEARSTRLEALDLELQNSYYMTGAFFRGDGKGYAEPAKVKVVIASSAPEDAIASLVRTAVAASPALAAMRLPVENTFALYVNGRRREVKTMKGSASPDAADPLKTYSAAPRPLPGASDLPDLVRRTGQTRPGAVAAAPAGTTTRITRLIDGTCRLVDPAGVIETDSVLDMPGMSHFTLKSDERGATGGAAAPDQGPSGLSLLSAGIAFCFMTQLSRYIEHMKFNIRQVRLVQFNPYTLQGSASDGSARGAIEPVDTHLFLHGDESDETHERLMKIAATTCYLHATLASALQPVVSIEVNGAALAA
jgi:uncharacterized OsmC-like protein